MKAASVGREHPEGDFEDQLQKGRLSGEFAAEVRGPAWGIHRIAGGDALRNSHVQTNLPLMTPSGAGIQTAALVCFLTLAWSPAAESNAPSVLPAQERNSPVAFPGLERSHRVTGTSGYVIDSWQSGDGLPHNEVRSIVQTPDGYLWLGTSYGLARFDGIKFSLFNPADTPGMVRGRIAGMVVDKDGFLWIASDLGELSRFRDNHFDRIPKRSPGEVNCLEKDASGCIWVGCGNGLLRVERGEVREFVSDGKRLKSPVRRLRFDPGTGLLWFDQDGLLFALRNGRMVEVTEVGSTDPISVQSFARRKAGGIWVIDTARRVRRSLPDGAITAAQELPFATEGWLSPILEDRRGNLWITSDKMGLTRISAEGEYERFMAGSGLNDNGVSAVFEDAEGNVWVGTYNGGLHRFKRRVFRVYGANDGLTDETIFGISVDGQQAVHVATRGGQVFRIQHDRFAAVRMGTTHTLTFDSSGRLWGNWFGGVLTAYRREGEGYASIENNWGSVFNRCTAMVEDRDGRVWFGGDFGLGAFHQGQFENWTGENLIPAVGVRALAAGANGALWVGMFDRGLYELKDGRVRSFRLRDGLPSDSIQSLYLDAAGVLWIGTFGSGLVRFYEGKFTQYTQARGLPNNVICGIVEDDRGELWMSSFHGIFRVAKTELERVARGEDLSIRCFPYGRSDGLASAEGTAESQPNVCKTADGRLWFATVKGLAVVDPSQIELNSRPPPVVIEELVVDEDVHPIYSASENGEVLEIPAGAQRVEMRYAGLSLVSPEQVQFQYRLEGHEKGWVNAGPRRTAYYTRVPPGRYRFQVKASNNNGVWNEAGASLTLRFLPHFWQTWWFAGLTLLAGLGCVSTVVRRLAVKKLQRQLIHAEQQRLVESERTRIARDMHDQLGSHLTRIGLLSEIINQQRSDPAQVETHLQGISQIARDLVVEMDQVVWAVNPKKDSLEALATYCCSYAEEFFALTPVSCRIDMPDTLPDLSLSSMTRYQFFLSFKEALNNVLKHAQATEVTLRWLFPGQVMVLWVEDNGRGFDCSRDAGDRNGLGNMRSRMTSIQGNVEIVSHPETGTRVRFEIPRLETPPAPSANKSQNLL
jgi:signal transduction histidine kinase/ligand-binding sensor domain-containing protein